jgi:hypothetical protein
MRLAGEGLGSQQLMFEFSTQLVILTRYQCFKADVLFYFTQGCADRLIGQIDIDDLRQRINPSAISAITGALSLEKKWNAARSSKFKASNAKSLKSPLFANIEQAYC